MSKPKTIIVKIELSQSEWDRLCKYMRETKYDFNWIKGFIQDEGQSQLMGMVDEHFDGVDSASHGFLSK